jgi:spermidine synthase
VLGGGDGLAVRELLKYPAVRRITLVDIDPAMTRLGQSFPAIAALNRNALRDPRVRIVHDDAFKFLERDTGLYDVILTDLPDPNTDVLAKLYTVEFYRMAKRRLSAAGAFVTQATSPLFAREAFWCIAASLREAGLHTAPYHVYVPSFGDWGFVLASPTRWRPSFRVPTEGGWARTQQKLGPHSWTERLELKAPTRYLNAATLPSLFAWSRDTAEVPVDVSTLDRPVVLQYYVNDWKQWE